MVLFKRFYTRCEGGDCDGKILAEARYGWKGIETLWISSSSKNELKPELGMAAVRRFFTSGPDEMSAPSDVSQIALGEKEWGTYFGNVEEAPPVPDILKILYSDCPLISGKKIWQTHTLVLIPEKVSGKTLTLEFMGQLVESPKSGYASRYLDLDLDIPDSLKQQSATSHWVLISNDVLRGKEGEKIEKTYSEQEMMIQNLAEKSQIPYTPPSVRDLVISIFMRHVRTGNYPFGQDTDFGFSRCLERDSKGDPISVGFYDYSGLAVFCEGDSDKGPDSGMGASWVIKNESL